MVSCHLLTVHQSRHSTTLRSDAIMPSVHCAPIQAFYYRSPLWYWAVMLSCHLFTVHQSRHSTTLRSDAIMPSVHCAPIQAFYYAAQWCYHAICSLCTNPGILLCCAVMLSCHLFTVHQSRHSTTLRSDAIIPSVHCAPIQAFYYAAQLCYHAICWLCTNPGILLRCTVMLSCHLFTVHQSRYSTTQRSDAIMQSVHCAPIQAFYYRSPLWCTMSDTAK